MMLSVSFSKDHPTAPEDAQDHVASAALNAYDKN